MKKLLCMLLTAALAASLLAGCAPAVGEAMPAEQGDPAPIEEGDPKELAAYLTGNSEEEYTLKENVTLDLTGMDISQDRTILLQDTTLTLIGTLTVGEGCISVQSCGAIRPTADMSALAFSFDQSQEGRIFDIHSDVEFVPPAEQDGLVVEQNDNWTSIKVFSDSESQPVGENVTASTAEEFIGFIGNPDVSSIELTDNIAADFSGSTLARNVTVLCGKYSLALSGSLTVENGGLLVIDSGQDGTGMLDISKLFVTANGVNAGAGSGGRADIVQIRMNFRQITGEPALTDGLAYEISDDGTQAFVYLKTADSLPNEQIISDFTAVLSGEKGDSLPGELFFRDTQNGVLELTLDDPVITGETALAIEGGVTLKLTGNVTFDGGLYRFDFAEGTSGRVTVDMTGLTVNATAEVGKTKSDNIVIWRESTGVDVLYDAADSHLSYTLSGNGNDELRFVQ